MLEDIGGMVHASICTHTFQSPGIFGKRRVISFVWERELNELWALKLSEALGSDHETASSICNVPLDHGPCQVQLTCK